MVKRPSYSTSDSADDPHASSSKRAKTADSDDDDEGPQIHMPHHLMRNGTTNRKRNPRRDGEDDVDDDDEPLDEDQNAELFENQHREKILANLEEKRKIHGGIAEHGIIESIEMHSFMCHKYLTFDFGPQINFIIGHNGSGKSAVLSAITVALGGKSTSTGRGSGLKSFIKEGCSVAEVTITLKNQGEEAYKPKEYGKSIVITRRFTKEGSTNWKIKSKSGNVISTKKEELSAICDHMNIQVDNPMNVLTQDAARQFLSASSPSDKYKFFLRGTQLSQLSTEYETCWSNIQQTSKVLAQKKAAIPDLAAAFQEASDRFKEASRAREQKQKADDLKRELAWAHVRAKEEEMRAKVFEAAKLESRLPKLQEKVDGAEAAVQVASADVAMYESEVAELGDIEELSQQRERIQAQIKANKGTINDYTVDLRRMEQSVNATTQQIEDLDRQIAAENERMATRTQARHDEMQRKLEAARERVNEAETGLQTIRSQMDEQTRKNDETKQHGNTITAQLDELRGKIKSCEGMIERAKQAQQNSLVPYGRNIKELLERIESTRWRGEKPLGPLGMYVKAKDPKKWGLLLRSQLGSLLTAFAVTDPKDRVELKNMLNQSGNHHVQIIISERDMFDYSKGELPTGYLTVLRALDISDPYVVRLLINSAKIERQLLAHSRVEAEGQLKELGGGGSAWTLDHFRVTVFSDGGSYSVGIQLRDRNDATSLLLTGRDPASEIRHYQEELKGYEESYPGLLSQEQSTKQAYMKGRDTFEALKKKQYNATEALRRAKLALGALQQEANDELPTGVASFQAAKTEAEEEKKLTTEQFEAVMTQKAELGEKQKVLLTKSNQLKRRIDEFMALRETVAAKVLQAVERRMEAQKDIAYYKKKYADEEGKVKEAKGVAEIVEEEFENWTKKAEEYCDRVEEPRKPEVVQRQLESVQKALAEREKRHGATVEAMTIEVNKAKLRLDTAKKDLREMAKLNKALRNSLVVRLGRWQEFRRHIALRCKLVFGYHLSQRGYYGKVLFNHDAQTLLLKVQTDDQIGTQASREKDPKSLSGGEKSFSTICLLLSLWESIGCPLRCLDEFDVFMDAVNRRISMRMMIETANSSDKKQYILITPQDMGNVQLGSTVKVNRMSDPERSQVHG